MKRTPVALFFASRFARIVLLSPLLAALACSDSTSVDGPQDGGVNMDTRTSSDVAPFDDVPSDKGPSDTLLADGMTDSTPPEDGSPPLDQSIPDDSASDAASPDAADIARDTTLPDGDASICTVVPVWDANSASFTFSITPTMIMKPPPNAECGGSEVDYTFDVAKRTLSQKGCVGFRPFDRVAPLDSAATDSIVSLLRGVRSTCSPDCRSWIPKQTLAVRDTAGCAQGSWEDDHCNFRSMPPFVPAADMDRLRELLDDILKTTCEPDGSSSDAGLCQPSTEGGADGCTAVPPRDAGADAPGDATIDAPLGDAFDGDGTACTVHPLGSDFTALDLRIPAADDAGCPNQTLSINVSFASRVLMQYDCASGDYTYRRVDLTPSQIDVIRANLATMRTSCVWHCRPDGMIAGIDLRSCSGEWLQFLGDTYNDCDQTPRYPFVDSEALVSLNQLLHTMVTESCGPATDATGGGMCTPRCRQGGL